MTVSIEQLGQSESELASWDDYVKAAENGTFFHLSGWQTVLKKAFGHKPFFLLAKREGRIVGVLPLAQVRSFLFGNHLVALPFCVYGGVVADDEEAANALREAACAKAIELNVEALEMRNIEATQNSDWPRKDLYVTFRKAIDPDHDVNLKAIPNRQRAMIRKGIANGLVSEPSDDSARLYRVYSESVRNLGTPVFSARYFKVLQEVFGDACRILMITHEGRDVAGVMSFYYKNEVLPYYGGSVAAARSIKGTNDFMYWELMRRSCDEGLSLFDFGRSKKGTGAYKFKKNWGFPPQDLNYEYFLVKAEKMPELNPNNPRYEKLIAIWRKLPLSVANRIGPPVAAYLG
ncbi:MAG: peptidoglycan bridge formation protein FemAB [Gammaproteobacteria bacterium]|nr:MAG: peptidoglycan bridge formation protein FemAB [Gammaproteobacteria bacterium]